MKKRIRWLASNRLLEQGILTAEDVDRIDKEVAEEVAETERFVNESPILDDPAVLDRAVCRLRSA
jgi:TPP-dependent pyruvate/acetoin dehydrogenase alpha subunit